MIKKDLIRVVGLDLDGTQYQSTPETDLRVRTKIAEKLLDKNPDLKNIENARQFFEQRYAILHSGTKVLEEAGYQYSSKVMDECLATANVIDLIKKDEKLAEIIERIHGEYLTFLLTASPEELARAKLSAIGINPASFDYKLYSDTPEAGNKNDGTAFKYLLNLTQILPEKHVYIGDRKSSDIIPAKNLGMKTIAVWSDIPEADLSIDHIYKLEEILL